MYPVVSTKAMKQTCTQNSINAYFQTEWFGMYSFVSHMTFNDQNVEIHYTINTARQNIKWRGDEEYKLSCQTITYLIIGNSVQYPRYRDRVNIYRRARTISVIETLKNNQDTSVPIRRVGSRSRPPRMRRMTSRSRHRLFHIRGNRCCT